MCVCSIWPCVRLFLGQRARAGGLAACCGMGSCSAWPSAQLEWRGGALALLHCCYVLLLHCCSTWLLLRLCPLAMVVRSRGCAVRFSRLGYCAAASADAPQPLACASLIVPSVTIACRSAALGVSIWKVSAPGKSRNGFGSQAGG